MERGASEQASVLEPADFCLKLRKRALTRRGYVVRATANPREALQWFASGYRPDLLVTDVRMPEMNGTVFARAAKEHDPNLKIILMSGDAAPSLAGQEHINGATFEQKPVSPPALLRAVRARLDEA